MSEPHHAIDLTRHAFQRHIGDLTIYGTWLWNDEKEGTEPALVIVPRYRLNGAKPCCIALSAAFRYDSPHYLAQAASRFAVALGFEDTMTRAYKIASLIHDHLRDLITMPPDPRRAVVVGEASVDTGNGRKQTVELLDHEQERPT